LDLVEAALESTEIGKSNVLGRCISAVALVLNGGVLVKNAAVANAADLGARGAALVLVLVEERCDDTLSISSLPLRSSDRHAERSSEEVTEITYGVEPPTTMSVISFGLVGDAQKVWT
jgi:hypothetical protein